MLRLEAIELFLFLLICLALFACSSLQFIVEKRKNKESLLGKGYFEGYVIEERPMMLKYHNDSYP